jgi:hypothetical protein
MILFESNFPDINKKARKAQTLRAFQKRIGASTDRRERVAQ